MSLMRPLADVDPEIFRAIELETERQRRTLELIKNYKKEWQQWKETVFADF
jgi:glycine/serine hydroxymethyltransferase